MTPEQIEKAIDVACIVGVGAYFGLFGIALLALRAKKKLRQTAERVALSIVRDE